MLGIAKHPGSGAWAGGAPGALFTPEFSIVAEQWRNFKSQIIDGSFRFQNITGYDLPFSANAGKFAASYCRYLPVGYYSSLQSYWNIGDPVFEGGLFEYQLWEPGTNNYGYVRCGAIFNTPSYSPDPSTVYGLRLDIANAPANIWRMDSNGLQFTPSQVEGVWTTWQVSASTSVADFPGFADPAFPGYTESQSLFIRYRMVNSIVGEVIQDRVINFNTAGNKTTWLNNGGFGFGLPQANGWGGQNYPIGDMQFFTAGNSTNAWQLMGHAVDWKAQGYRLCDQRGLPKFIGTDTIPTSGGDQTATTYVSCKNWPTYTWVYDPDPQNNIYNYRYSFPPDYTVMTGTAAVVSLDFYGESDVATRFNGINPYGV